MSLRPWRTWLAPVALVLALLGYAWWANRHDPVREWLLLVYLRHWAYTTLFFLAAFASGWRLLALLLREPPPLGERFTYAMGAGTLLFGTGIFVAGWLSLLGRLFFFAWPLLLVAWGGPRLLRDARHIHRRLHPLGSRLWIPARPIDGLCAAGLALLLVALYLLVMTPENIGWDARWYHLSVAEHYVAQGKIRGFGEGWYLGTYPQLASWLYTWAFQAPERSLFHHCLLSAHLEWCLFLATLPGIAALVRRLAGVRAPFAAAALLLYPGLLLYDSSLIVGADHILAFWGPGLALALWRLCKRSARPRHTDAAGKAAAADSAVLLAIFTSGAALTKYQAVYFVVPLALILLLVAIKHRRWAPLSYFFLSSLALTAPHWLKNLLLHGNPTYPLLHSLFPSHPFHPGAGTLLRQIYMTPLFALKGTLPQKITRTASALFDFSFVPNDWVMFHGQRPVFGSLFTLLLPALLLVRAGVRLWTLILALHLGVAIWYITSHQDRFLQALVPLMAAATAAAIIAIWRQAPRARIALLALLGFQLVWGADVYFLRTHAMVGDSPLKPFADRIAGGHEKKGPARFTFGGTLADLGRDLPRSARVLFHDLNIKLGIGRPTVVDEIGWQGMFEYVDIETPARAYELWRKLGVTHVLWQSDRGDQTPTSLAREAVFTRTVKLHRLSETSNGGLRMTSVAPTASNAAPASPPPPPPAAAQSPTRIAWLGCGGDPTLGVYSPRGLASRGAPLAPIDANTLAMRPAEALRDANAAIIRGSCGGMDGAQRELSSNFDLVINAGGVALYLRRHEGGAP